MSEAAVPEQPAGGSMSLGDIYFILFRRKWIIVTFALLGVCAAGVLFLIKPPRYRSEQKLFIRYVAEGKSPTPTENATATRALNEKEASILSTEAQIVQSLDVAREAATSVGPEKILAKYGGGSHVDWAADLILANLEIELMPQQGSVISLVFQHKDPEIAQKVLKEVVTAYIKKHKEMHQSAGLFEDFFIKETSRLRSDLATTEQQLREVKANAGVISLEQSKKDYAVQIGRIREELLVEQADLARQQAILEELPKLVQGNIESNTNSEVRVPIDHINDYRNISLRIKTLETQVDGMRDVYTTNAAPMKLKLDQIAEARIQKKKLEEQYPELANMVVAPRPGQSTPPSTDITTATIRVKGLKATIELLTNQLAQIQTEAAKLDLLEVKVTELERTRQLQESDLKYFLGSLEQSRIEGALGSGKAANIIPINSEPTGAVKAWSKTFKKKVQMIAFGGLMAGIAFAFLLELFIDRSVKRPTDVVKKLRLPLFISIPDLNRNGYREKKAKGEKDPAPAEGAIGWPVENWDRNHPLRRFYEGLRDRLIIHFEVNNVARKPKIVGVTSCGKGVGVSSIAAGLAASLSETGDGKVLLVDMNAEQGSAQQFHKGKLTCSLDDALAPETMKSALVQSNLYVVSEGVDPRGGADGGSLPQILPKRFAHLIPKLEASHFDYIIFDMPPVSTTSMTARLGRIMDMVLFVIEAEKTGVDVAKQATALLAESKVKVTAVLNRTHNYVPTRLHLEYLHDA
jgi:polysaccharide biosynthesis transport protein